MNAKLLLLARVALLALSLSTPSWAQRLSGGTTGLLVQRRVSYEGIVDEQSGTWFGAEGSVQWGRITLGASGLFGSLGGAADALVTPDLTVRVSGLSLGVSALPWLDLAAVAEARRQESAVGVSVWRLIGPQLRIAPQLGLPGLSASAELTLFSSASIIGGTETLSPAVRAVVGATWAPARLPVRLRLGYRFERYDFGAVGTSPPRLEQFSGLQAGLDIPLRRRASARAESASLPSRAPPK